jgi:hypothetical protein
MAHNPKFSNDTVSAETDAACARMDGGTVTLYDGTQPADADTAPTGSEHVLSVHALDAPAFGAAVNGLASANPIGDDTDANATGNASWFRVAGPLAEKGWDGSVGVTGSDSDLEMPTVAIQQHAVVSVTGLSFTASKG